MSKWPALVVAVLLIIGMATACFLMFVKITDLNNKLEYATSIIKDSRNDIQALNNELKIAESKLVTSEIINEKYAEELSRLESNFQALVKKHKLQLDSRDNLIAVLKGKISGGTTTVVIKDNNPETTKTSGIEYSWQDPTGRFQLKDKDIFVENNEEFTYKQQVSITGYVYTDKSGDVKIRKLVLDEVLQDSKGNFNKVPNTNITVANSKFEYVNEKRDKALWDIVYPRLLASMDTQLQPGIGLEVINFGRYFDYINVGINTKIAINTNNLPNDLSKSKLGVGISYQLLPPILDTNIAVGAGLSTPFDDAFGKYIVTLDAIFYLTN